MWRRPELPRQQKYADANGQPDYSADYSGPLTGTIAFMGQSAASSEPLSDRRARPDEMIDWLSRPYPASRTARLLAQSGRRDGAAIASAIDDAIGILGAVMELSITPA